MQKADYKDATYTLIAGIAKAMGNPHRLEILELLINGAKNVEAIAKETRLSVANASQHLQLLKQHKLVTIRKEGTTIYYSLSNESIVHIINNLHTTAKSQLPELGMTIRQFRSSYGSNKHSIDQLPEEDHILLDLRSSSEFNHAHKRGAINIPIQNLNTAMRQMDKGKMIVAYCRGELCTYADEAVKVLRQAGFNAVRLNEPVLEIA
ncbi:MAG: metalloregulator ArsR/SmtB family transcription factor [Bacteroidota bacterium]